MPELYSNNHIAFCLIRLRFPEGNRLVGNSVKTEHWFLGAPSAKSKSALRQGIVIFRLCPRKVHHLRFSFCKIFTSEARNDLAEPVEVDAFEGGWIEAFPNGFPRLATSHERAEMPVSLGS